jgi:hypothetical protein
MPDKASVFDHLSDGRMPSTDNAPVETYFLLEGTLEGRIRLDLGKVIDVAAVNTYSRHVNTRGPQVYTLYASDGTAALLVEGSSSISNSEAADAEGNGVWISWEVAKGRLHAPTAIRSR